MARKPYPVHNIHAYQCIHDHDCMHSTNTPVPAHIRIPLSSIALTLSTRDLDRPMLAFSITLVLGCLARYFTHEERWVAHGAAMRQPGEDQVQSTVLSTMKYPTRTNRAEQTEVSRNQATHGTNPEGCQTIQKKHPGITSYPNHVMYVPWPTDN